MRTNDTSDRSPMATLHGVRIVVLADEIPAAKVVNVTVAVVIHAGGPRQLDAVRPHVWSQIRIATLDPRIRHGDHDTAASRGKVPGVWRFDVQERPLILEERIVRLDEEMADHVRLGV